MQISFFAEFYIIGIINIPFLGTILHIIKQSRMMVNSKRLPAWYSMYKFTQAVAIFSALFDLTLVLSESRALFHNLLSITNAKFLW